MDPNKDIWQQFSEQQDAWDEAPPASAWDKLEARLEAAPPDQPGRPWKPFALPGTGILLVVLMGLGLLRTGIAPREETKPDFPTEKSEQIASTGEVASTQDLVQLDAGELPTETSPAQDSLPLENPVGNADQAPQQELPINSNYVQMNPIRDISLDTLFPTDNFAPYNYDNSQLNPGQMVVTNTYGNLLDTVGSLQQFRGGIQQGRYANADNQYLQLNMARNDVSYAPRGNAAADYNTLDHFNWLLGSWKREGPSGATYEQWQQLDQFTIEGRGYFVVNGDTMVTEKMRIEQRGDNVYYIVALDTNRRPVKFRLRSREPGELIFENPKKGYPQEIIVRKADADNFSTILQNPSQGYQQRQEEVRNMRRAKSREE